MYTGVYRFRDGNHLTGQYVHMALTETWLRANNGKVRERAEEFTDRDAVSVRASAKGRLTFQLRFRIEGKAARIDLGTYPAMGLKQARELAEQYRAMVADGRDPRIERELERRTVREAITLKDLFSQYYDRALVSKKRSHAQVKRSFELHVFEALGSLPAGRLTTAQWLDYLEPMADEIPAIVQRLLANLGQMYDWAIKRDLVKSNPVRGINAAEDLGIKPGVSTRFLSDQEIALLFRYLTMARVNPRNAIFMKLCLIYGCRNGELRLAERRHLDFERGIWTIPPENHKTGDTTGEPLLRPIIPETRALFERAMAISACEYVFAGVRNRNEVMGRSNTLCFPSDARRWIEKHEGVVMPHWSIHDLRRTARTNFSSLTTQRTAEVLLGHLPPKVVRVYDHHDYLEEQAQALQKWCEKLRGLIAPCLLV